MSPRTVCVSGYFNPLTVGHVEYFERARQLAGPGGQLVVIVNSDHQSRLKKGTSFMPEAERLRIVRALRVVDHAVLSIDRDRTVCATLKVLAADPAWRPDVFANGGDQNNDTIPEREICEAHGVQLVDGLGDKIQSSSWLIAAAARAATDSVSAA